MPRDAIWSGVPAVKGSTEIERMILLTFSLIGLQLCWGLEMTYCMPYLLELGLTKSKTSLVWIAGPISGLVVAPLIGAVADRSKSSYGRRRPFMLGGSAVVVVCFWILGWAAEIVEVVVGKSKSSENVTILVAVVSIYAVDFAINVVQWSCRGLIVDTLPTAKQQTGSAWAGRMTAVGHLIGYAVGALDLKSIFGGFLGSTQFKQMSLISAFSLVLAVGVTCYATTEKILVADGEKEAQRAGPVEIFRQIFSAAVGMPKRTKAICWVQFWSWGGWFPFLFYSSTWVGEIHFRHELPDSHRSTDKSGDIGRIGSMALIVFSLVTFAGSVVLPWLVQSPDDDTSFTPRPPPSLAPVVDGGARQKPSLESAWLLGHVVFAVAMGLAPLVTSVKFATALVGLCGISWAIASWAPFTFMGVEINRLGRQGLEERRTRRNSNTELESMDDAGSGALAGVYLGILNLFTAGPQLMASFVSMAVFWALEPGPSRELSEGRPAARDGWNAIAVCLFIGALSSLGAAYATTRLQKMT